jgi:hypothetical protein
MGSPKARQPRQTTHSHIAPNEKEQSASAIALIAGAGIFATAAPTQQSGTADEAKAMLTKTVSALKRPKHST